MTVNEAARLGRCSIWLIHRLLKDGKLQAHRETDDEGKTLRTWNITTAKTDILPMVLKESPRSGYRVTKHAKPKRKTAKNGSHAPRVAAAGKGLQGLLELAAIPKSTRDVLMKLAKRFTADELKLLTEL